jgi:hypothetical protein
MVTSKASNVDEFRARCDAPPRFGAVHAVRHEGDREARVEEDVIT